MKAILLALLILLLVPSLALAQGMGSSEFDYGGSGGTVDGNYLAALEWIDVLLDENRELKADNEALRNHEYKEFENVFELWAWAREAWEEMPYPRGQNKCGDCSQWTVQRAHQDGYNMSCEYDSYRDGTAHFYNSTWIGDNYYMVDLYTPEPRVCWVSFKY